MRQTTKAHTQTKVQRLSQHVHRKQNNKQINLHNTEQTFTHTLKMVGSTSKTKQKVQSLKPQ